MQSEAFAFVCPRCKQDLEWKSESVLCCPSDGLSFERHNGIWHFLLPEQHARYRQFIQEYETVRSAEGRGSDQPEYYRSLPYRDTTGTLAGDWKIRARSFDELLEKVVLPAEAKLRRPLAVLDLGAGNSWLANRMALRGHRVAAVDLTTNAFDGLGARRYYESSFLSVQTDFSHLPFENGSIDLAVFNASFHYAVSYDEVLSENLRVVGGRGSIIVLDTPVYHSGSSGEQMVAERQAYFTRLYGFPSNAIPSENYLTYARLEQLAERFGLQWQAFRPFYGWKWAVRPFLARLRRKREPAAFTILVFQRKSDSLP